MKIFIDESGNFLPGPDQPVSVVGALWVPHRRFEQLVKRYTRALRPGLPKNAQSGEVKGSALDEYQVARVIDFLLAHEAVATFVFVDHASFDAADIARHRASQVDRIRNNMTGVDTEEIRSLADRVEALADQLYVQFVCLTLLVDRVIRTAIIYLGSRSAEELEIFDWVIDSKVDKKSAGGNPVESFWSLVASSVVQSIGISDPPGFLPNVDYGSFFRSYGLESLPKHLVKFSRNRPGSVPISAGRLMAQMAFSADADPGLELVDIVTNASRRAFRNRMGPAGWKDLPQLTISSTEFPLRMVTLGKSHPMAQPDQIEVYKRFVSGGRPLLPATYKG